MFTRDRVAGVVILLFSLGVMWETRVLPLGTFHNPGPGYMPMLLAIVLGAMGILVAIRGGGSPPLRLLEWTEKNHALAILAGWGTKRVAALPDLPTFKDAKILADAIKRVGKIEEKK